MEYLKKRYIKVTILDIRENLKPDINASVTSIPVSDEKFELVACFETLEHLPYKLFPKALNEIFRVCSRNAIISLPDIEGYFRIDLKIPKIRKIKILSTIQKIRKPVHQYDLQQGHYWEIGKRGYRLKKILSEIKKSEFKIVETYRIFEAPYYRFFILKKKKQ